MPADYHIHTKLCGHADGEMEDYIGAAKEAGLKEICFADHIPMYFLAGRDRDPGVAMPEEGLPGYIEQVRGLAERYYPFPVRLGIEADFVPGQEKNLADILEKFDFDYVLGAIHFLDGWGFDNPNQVGGYQKWDLFELYAHYFDYLGQAAHSGLFDSLAHPDLIKKFGFRPAGDLVPLYEQTIQKIADAGVCVEINTAGLRVPVGEIYPQVDFLRLCHRFRVPVTLGSDAHRPEQVGAGFSEALDLIKSVGYQEISVFAGRKKKTIRL